MGLGSSLKSKLLGRTKKNVAGGPKGDVPSSSATSTATSMVELISTPVVSDPPRATENATTTTITTQSPPEQVISSTLEPLNPTPPALSVQPAESDGTCSGHETEPWTLAYKIFHDREPELMADYKTHVASLQPDAAASGDLSTPRSVELIVTQLLEHREKKQWRIPFLGKDVIIRNQVEKLTKFLLWSDPVVKNALSAQPYAALAWSGVSLLLPLLTSGTTQMESMLKGFNSIGEVQMYWAICEETYFGSTHQQHYQDLIEPLAKLYSHVIEYQARVICHLSKAQLSRAWQSVAPYDWAGKASEIDELSKRRSDCISSLNEREVRERWNQQLLEMQESRDILNEIRRILEEGGKQTQNYEDQKERDLLRDLASDYEGYKNFNPLRVKDTCEWFFKDDRFRRWRASDASRLLWVSAGPGCGKSVLSRALIDEHRLSTNVTTSHTCYFFFKDGDENRMSSTSALCAILHQLFTQDPNGSLIKNALPSHRNHGKALTQNFSELWQILEKCARSSDAGEIICLLDALDECNGDGRRQLINQLKEFYSTQSQLSSGPSKLKFLITSRPYDDLEASFRKFSATAAYMRFDGDDKSEEIHQEINLVINARMDDIAIGFADEDRRMISERLKSMEHRTYLWLHLTCDIIEQSPSEYGRRSDLENLLNGLPSQVSEAYERILDRSKNQTQTEALLRIVLAAARPLTLDEANIALAMALENQQFTSHTQLESRLWPRDNFKSIVKNLCGLFINVFDSKLSFIHQTAREFLVHSERQGKWKGLLNMPKSQSTISRSCLQYLLLPDIETPLKRDPANEKPTFVPYAAAYWPLHYLSQEDAVAHEFRKEARMLCNVAGHQANIWAPIYLDKGHTAWDWGWLDLVLASYLGLKLVVEDILLEEKTDINMRARFTSTALQAASKGGHKDVVQMLLDRGASINDNGNLNGTALQAAAAEGHRDVVQMLLDRDANVNLQGGLYDTALHAASARGRKDIVQMLLDRSADVNLQDKDDGTALRAAAERGYDDIVQMLLDGGADPNLRGGDYGTALRAASARGHKVIVQKLLNKDANVDLREGDYGTALHSASKEGYIEIVQILLDSGADVNLQEGDYGTALQMASKEGHKDIVQMLLDRDANVNLQGGYYNTALQAASAEGHKDIVQMLLDRDADVNLQGGLYDTALEAAVEEGYEDIAQLLQDRGAE